MTPEEKLSRIRLVVCDMDRTILRTDKRISRRTVRAVHAARECGVEVMLCSARVFSMMEYYTHALDIRAPAVSCNGAAIVEPGTRRVLYENPVPEADALEILRFCRENGIDHGALGLNHWWFCEGSMRAEGFTLYNEVAGENRYPPMPLELFDAEFRCIRGESIHKIPICERTPGDCARVAGLAASRPGLIAFAPEPGYLDVVTAGNDKGAGVTRLARLLDIPLEQVCVMGDFDNDLPMFAVAGLSVAMENGTQRVKSAADLCTGTNDGDGVAEFLEQNISRKIWSR